MNPERKKSLASKRLEREHKPGDKDSKVVSKANAKVKNKDVVIHNLKRMSVIRLLSLQSK
jgi:hypothetical protein